MPYKGCFCGTKAGNADAGDGPSGVVLGMGNEAVVGVDGVVTAGRDAAIWETFPIIHVEPELPVRHCR